MKVLENKFADIPKENIIMIDVIYTEMSEEFELQIAASTSSKLNFTKEHLQSRFQTFALNVSNYISDYDFVIEDEHPSDRGGSLSYYITFYPTDNDGNIRDKYLIFLRLSDHNLKGLSKRSRNYHKNTAKKFKRSDNSRQLYIFENIVVDGDKEFKSFASALNHINDMLDCMKDGSYYE